MKINIKKLSKKQIIIFSVIAVFIIALLAWGGISIARHEDPITAMNDVITGKDALIGNWQGEKAITAYVFYSDGTYQSYISSYPIDGTYELKGNKITLKALNADGSVTYKYSIRGDTLTLTLVDSNGTAPEEEEEHTFTKVDQLNMKDPIEIIQDFAEEIQGTTDANGEQETEEATEAETEE